MNIQPIGATSLALYLTSCDLRLRGLTPETLDLKHALAITREACQEAGFDLSDAMEIEAYPDNTGVLVFARLRTPDQLYFSFPSLPLVLDALAALPAPPAQAQLSWMEDSYLLTFPGPAEETSALLSEFGTERPGGPMAAARLAEYGQPLLSAGELARLHASLT